MIKHIVMWRLKPVANSHTREENLHRVKDMLDSCSGIVPGMLKYEVGLAAGESGSTHDVVLYSEFASREALAAYNSHPSHLAIKPLITELREERHAIDYEL